VPQETLRWFEHGRVESGEELLGDDEDLGELVQLGEGLADLPLQSRTRNAESVLRTAVDQTFT